MNTKSAVKASIVMLAVPFALSGGIFLQWLLGYRFNGAVWVGYIALFGTASPVALATIVGVLVEVPVMLGVVKVVNSSKGWYERG